MENTPEKQGNGKLGATIISAWLASYIMTQLSLRGFDFSLLGVSSEVVKSTIIGTLVGFFAWLTPSHFVQAVRDAIVFCRDAVKEWKDALNNKGDTQ